MMFSGCLLRSRPKTLRLCYTVGVISIALIRCSHLQETGLLVVTTTFLGVNCVIIADVFGAQLVKSCCVVYVRNIQERGKCPRGRHSDLNTSNELDDGPHGYWKKRSSAKLPGLVIFMIRSNKCRG